MLLNQIKADSLAARKAKDGARATLLVTLYAEAAKVGKDAGNRESTDDEVLKTVKKFLKGVEDSLAVLPQGAAREQALFEQAVLQAYLPRMVQGDELKAVVDDIVAALPQRDARAMGAVMKELKARLGSQYDGAQASALAKAALA